MSVQEISIHDRLAQAMRAAAEDVFSTMLGMPIEAGAPRVVATPPAAGDGVVSFIGMAGSWVGTGSIACSAPLACRISGALLMSEYESVNEEVLDAVAEVTNMIIGNVKTTIEAELGPMGLSIPTVIYGKNFTTRSVGSHEWTITTFTCDAGDGTPPETFEVQACLMPNREGQSLRTYLAGSQPWHADGNRT